MPEGVIKKIKLQDTEYKKKIKSYAKETFGKKTGE